MFVFLYLAISGQISTNDGCPPSTQQTKRLFFRNSGRNLNISCWNVSTPLDNKDDCRPERHAAFVAHEQNIEDVEGGYAYMF